MKHFLRSFCVFLLGIFSIQGVAQTNVICPISAGTDQTICVPNCATLTGTFVPTNQTTSYAISTIPYAPDPYNAGTAVAVGDDQWSAVINIGFTFCFYGVAHTQCIIGSNGDLGFNTANALAYNTWPIGAAVPTTSVTDLENAILGPWQDLYPPGGGTIKWALYGTAPCRRFVASWNAVAMYSCTTTPCTQQITLYETTNIIENFISTKGLCSGWNGGNAIQAIQNPTGTAAVVNGTRNYPTQWTTTNDAIRYTPTGAPTYTIGWYQGATLLSATATTVVCPNATTTYTFQETSTDCNGVPVTVSDQMNVTTSALVLSGASTNSNSCTICNGTATATVVTGTGPFTYSWAPVGGNAATATNLCPGNYTCTVTGAGGCQGTQTFAITGINSPTSTQSQTNITCNAACNGAATITPSPVGAYTYLWMPGSQTTQTATGLCAGIYTVTATNASGCTTTQTITITEPPALTATSSSTAATCGSQNGSASVVASGGSPTYGYSWAPVGGNAATASNLGSGTYTCTITDANNCSITEVVVVTSTSSLVSSINTSVNVSCFGGNNGSATVTNVGGNPGFVYSWNPSAQTTQTATGLTAGPYTVTVTDASGCSDTASVTITQPTQLTNTVAGSTTICIGQNTTLTDAAGGGTPTYTYAWTDGTNNWTTQNITVSPIATTTYSVVVTDANGCVSAPQTITVTVNPPLNVQAMASISVCAGSNVNLTATGNGGDGNLTYTWLPGNLTGNSINLTANATTTYSVILTDGCGTPADTSTVTITVNPNPTVSIAATSDTAGCQPLCVTFANNTPNTASIVWTFGNNLGTSTLSNPTFCFTSAGTYNVSASIIDNSGCVGSDTLLNEVTVWPLPHANFTASPQPTTLLNSGITFTDLSTGAVSWSWHFGSDTAVSSLQNPIYAFQDTGTFNVQLIVTNQFGCEDSIILPVEIKADYALFIPNAFTPNGDGNNDLFFPKGVGVNPDNFKMYIFDRWGNLIYQTSTWPGGWDGTVQGTGRLCQIDTYVYKITATDPDGSRRVYIGSVNLIR